MRFHLTHNYDIVTPTYAGRLFVLLWLYPNNIVTPWPCPAAPEENPWYFLGLRSNSLDWLYSLNPRNTTPIQPIFSLHTRSHLVAKVVRHFFHSHNFRDASQREKGRERGA